MIKPLWAPWRMEFIVAEKKGGCVFCDLPQENETEDRKNLILYRGESCFVMLNKYPYNLGHVMVIPFGHTKDFAGLGVKQITEMGTLAQKATQVLTEVYEPQGFNLGMNLGKAGGAGIEEHLHLHVVPRWNGDTNFMPVIGESKAMPEHLLTCFDKCFEVYRRKSS